MRSTRCIGCAWVTALSISCTASSATTNVYTLVHMWTDAIGYPFPNLGAQHKCRNFDTLNIWLDRTPEANVHRISRVFKDVHGWFETHEDTYSHGEEICACD